jgi:predicted nucleic acid-binding protein
VPIVVSDTSPVRALYHLELLGLLELLYGKVIVPDAVAIELRRSGLLFPSLEPLKFPFFIIESPVDVTRVQSLQSTLDPGEAAALVLAIEKKADFVLMDERQGRIVAAQLGVKVVGVLAVLVRAKRQSLVPALKPLIDRLVNELKFRLSTRLIAEILKLGGE